MFATKIRLLKVDRVQYEALRIVTGALRPIPLLSLLVECNELLLSHRRSYHISKFILKQCIFINLKILE